MHVRRLVPADVVFPRCWIADKRRRLASVRRITGLTDRAVVRHPVLPRILCPARDCTALLYHDNGLPARSGDVTASTRRGSRPRCQPAQGGVRVPVKHHQPASPRRAGGAGQQGQASIAQCGRWTVSQNPVRWCGRRRPVVCSTVWTTASTCSRPRAMIPLPVLSRGSIGRSPTGACGTSATARLRGVAAELGPSRSVLAQRARSGPGERGTRCRGRDLRRY